MTPSIARGALRIGLVAASVVATASSPGATAEKAAGLSAPTPIAGEGAFRHLQALQAIAVANAGNRAAGTAGYDRSAEYVAARLREAGYTVRFEEFEFPFFEERTPPRLAVLSAGGMDDAAPTAAFRTLSNSGSGDVTARLGAVNLALGAEPSSASASGCEAGDFRDFTRGAVVLLRRGTCTFQVKADNAAAAGATGVIIMNEGTEGRKDTFSGQIGKPAAIPVVGVSYEFGRTLVAAAQRGASVHLAVDAVTGRRSTRNVLAETPSRDGPLVIVGAHLDSVAEGPGINDNGSGSAAVLEAALQSAEQLAKAGVAIRFAFWGAEERGLVGSRHHVASLSDAERGRITVYINLDMVGTINHVRYVQGAAPAADSLAATVRGVLLAEFQGQQLPVEERAGGRTGTDDASFSEKGVPTVGLYTGAGGMKSEALASQFGGEAGKPFDPCYHRACDTLDNINRDLLEQNTHALVRALGAVVTARQGRAVSPAQ